MGDYRKAIELFEAGLKKDPTNRNLLNMVSSIYAELGEHGQAIIHLKNLTKYHPDYSNAYYFLALSQHTVEQYKEAKLSLDTFMMGKELRPDYFEKAQKLYKSLEFAIKAKDNPIDVTFENMGKSINTKNHEYW